MPLTLCANTGRHTNFPVSLNRDPCALVGTHTGCLNKRYDTDPYMPACSAQAWLFLSDEFIIANQCGGFLQHGLVISAIQDERGKSLVDNPVLVRKRIWRDVIPLTNFDWVYAQLLGGYVQ